MPVSDTVYIDIIANATKGIAGIAKLGAAYFAVSKIVKTAIRIGADLIDSYREQEQAEAKLTAALRATGRQYEVSLRGLADYASELQSVTTYGDEATISAMAMLQQLGDLDEKGLRALTPLVQDFATAMGIDLQTAASLVGKTLGSTTNALSRYGVQIDATAPKGEKLAALTEVLRRKFGGFSAQVAQTGTGALQQLNNIMSDMKEEGGKALLDFLKPAISKLNEFLGKTLQAWSAQRNLNAALKGQATSVYEVNKAIEQQNQNTTKELQALDDKYKRLRNDRQAMKDYKTEREKVIEQGKQNIASLEKEREEIAKTNEVQSARVRIIEIEEKKQAELNEVKALGGTLTARQNKEMLQGIELGKYITGNYEQQIDLTDRQNKMLLQGIDYTGKYEQALAKEGKAGWEDYVSAGAEALGSIETLWSNYYDRRMAGMDEESEEYKRLAREKAEGEKRWALFMALVNTAVAVVKALPNPILAAIVGAAGMAQMAAIAAAPIPALAEGGIATRPTVAMIGERGPEAVVPLGRGFGPRVTVFVYGSVMEGEDLARKIWATGMRQRRGY